ncbi:hypothetical protein V494_03674 [Pseudogymnoascus sp. VKM F-4513 (FW-928)]|nr:hypothetical protein V494_03674 [Pseudogymnoascus sp. VKM F-4513 (FW-928)]
MELSNIRRGFQNAALVAHDAEFYDEVSRGSHNETYLPVQLTPDEKLALRNEKDHLFAQSKGLYMTVLTVSIAAILQGWVQSSINGATLLWPSEFGLLNKTDPNLERHDQWIVGLTNAAPFLFAAILGCPLVDPINRRCGRKGTILVAAVLIFASSLGSAFSNNWVQLFVCRIFNGIGMGLKASSTPILAAETAVSRWRGSSALCWQLWVAFGLALGFAANLIVNTASKRLSMKLQLGAPIVPALLLMVSLWWCPESPRWHMMKGRNDRKDRKENYRKAYNIFLALRNTPLQAQRDFYLIHKQIEIELKYMTADNDRAKAHSYANRISELFSSNLRLRSALVAACTVNLAQQLCGINVLAFYSSDVFSKAGKSDDDSNKKLHDTVAYLYSFGFGAINFVFCIPAIRNIDTRGRRALLLRTLPFMAIFLFAAAACFHIPANDNGSAQRIGPIALFLFLFAAVYSPGMGPMPFTVASESFPLSHREVGVAVSVGLNLFFAGLLSLFYLRIDDAFTSTGSLCLFASFNLVAAALIFLLLPETKERSLEELDKVFSIPIKKFMHHQLFEVLPYYVNYYILGKKVKLEELWDPNIGIELPPTIHDVESRWHPSWSATATRRRSIAAIPPDGTDDGTDITRLGSHNASQNNDARYGRLIGNLIGTYLYRPYPILSRPKYSGNDVTVLIPTITDDMEELRPHFLSILATPIHQLVLVTTDIRKAKLLAFSEDLADPRIKVYSTPIANKRTQLAAVIPLVRTAITVLVDDDVTWTHTILPWLLAPFEIPRNGSVGVGMAAIRIRTGSVLTRCINFLGAVYLERRNFEGAATLTLDGGISCMSGRTNALRTCILQDEAFLNAFCYETFNGVPIATGDDKMITRWLVQEEWGMYVQYHPEAQLLTTLESGWKFIYQCQRWAGSSWRGNYKTLFVESNPWTVFKKQPWTFYAKYIAVFTSIGLITDPLTLYCYYQIRPLLEPTSLWAGTSGWVVMSLLYLFTKTIKLKSLFIAYPKDLVFLPVSILFGLFHGFIKMKAFCKDKGWLSR